MREKEEREMTLWERDGQRSKREEIRGEEQGRDRRTTKKGLVGKCVYKK